MKQGKPGLAKGSPAHTQKPTPLSDTQMEALQDMIKEGMKEGVAGLSEELKGLKKDMERMEEGLQGLKEEMGGMKEEIKEEIAGEMIEVKKIMEQKNEEIREDIILAVSCLASSITSLEVDMDEVKQTNTVLENKIEQAQVKLVKAEEEGITAQYRSMEFALRIRGFKENKEEDLEERCAAAFAEILENQAIDFSVHIDKTYRVNSWIARQKSWPRDVVVYFTTRKMRNAILQASYKNKVKINGDEILVLKELPPKMLKLRKEFAFLTGELKKRQLQFRWEVPAGITLVYEGQRYRLNSVWKAKDFYINVLKAGNLQSPKRRDERELKVQEEKKVDEKEIQGAAALEKGELSLLTDAVQIFEEMQDSLIPQEQRVTRAALKKEKERIQKLKDQQEMEKTEVVGGARQKRKLDDDLHRVLQKLRGAKDGN